MLIDKRNSFLHSVVRSSYSASVLDQSPAVRNNSYHINQYLRQGTGKQILIDKRLPFLHSIVRSVHSASVLDQSPTARINFYRINQYFRGGEGADID